MHAAKVLLVGAGAAGQNLAQNLALCGVGNILIVDDDRFEPHNATRSPLFPTASEVDRNGWGKAVNVAARVRSIATAPDPNILYFAGIIQDLGDAPFRWGDVVVSAVDNLTARALLAMRSRIHGKPMLELGFSGPSYGFSAFSPTNGPCFRCNNPGRESSASCTHYALAAEAASIIPAIQTTAATVSGFLTEQIIQVIHARCDTYGKRFSGNVRNPQIDSATLPANDRCPGFHTPIPSLAAVTRPSDRLGDLIDMIHATVGPVTLVFAEPVIVTITCTRCKESCTVGALEGAWLRAPRCTSCDGPWVLTGTLASPESILELSTGMDVDDHIADLSCDALGLRSGGAVVVHDGDALSVVHIKGDITDYVPTTTATFGNEVAINKKGCPDG
jgi:molybdopterin/thiamine biosynthesis adenylyltransferase